MTRTIKLGTAEFAVPPEVDEMLGEPYALQLAKEALDGLYKVIDSSEKHIASRERYVQETENGKDKETAELFLKELRMYTTSTLKQLKGVQHFYRAYRGMRQRIRKEAPDKEDNEQVNAIISVFNNAIGRLAFGIRSAGVPLAHLSAQQQRLEAILR